MKKITLKFIVFTSLLILSNNVNSQIYSNGNLSTGVTAANSTIAPTGYTWSETQNDTGNTTERNASFGFQGFYNNASTSSFQLADDFTVPAGSNWSVTGFEFYGYQTNYAGTTIPIDQLSIQIFNGDPSTSGAISIAGSMVTNVLDVANSGEANMYRISNTAIPTITSTGTSRKIWKFRGNLITTLSPGTYWVVFQTHAIDDGAINFPPVTVVGSRGLSGWNAKLRTIASTTSGAVLGWSTLFDTGLPATAPDINQDMPFNINGSVVLKTNEFEKLSNFILLPNPVNDNFQINSNSNAKLISIEIVDSLGRIVKTILPQSENDTSFNCSDLQTGNYLVKVKYNDGIEIKKMIKN